MNRRVVASGGSLVDAGAGGSCHARAAAARAGDRRERRADVQGGPVLAQATAQSLEHAAGHRASHVDHMDHIWFLNRGAVAEGDEIGGGDNPPRIECCVRGPELIELDQEGNVVNAWGGPGYHPQWPTALQTVIADTKGFVWVAGTAAQDSILKFTRDGKFVWDFGHRPTAGSGR